MSKNGTPFWREAHVEVKMYKTPQVRSSFRSCDVEKWHAVVVRSTFCRQNVQNTPCSDHFWKLRCRKSARRCGAKHISRSKCSKHVRTTFGRADVVSRGRRKGLCTFLKVSTAWGFCSMSKNDGRRGTFEEDLQDAFSLAGAIQETCSSELLGGPGTDFLRRVAFWSIRSSGSLRCFCVTGAALCMTWHHCFVAGAVL